MTRCVGDPVEHGAQQHPSALVTVLTQVLATADTVFAGSTEGAHAMAVLMALSATCRNLGVDPQAYFTWALERRGTHAEVFGWTRIS